MNPLLKFTIAITLVTTSVASHANIKDEVQALKGRKVALMYALFGETIIKDVTTHGFDILTWGDTQDSRGTCVVSLITKNGYIISGSTEEEHGGCRVMEHRLQLYRESLDSPKSNLSTT